MIKTLQTNQKREQEPYRVPRSVQNAIPIMRLWENGLFQIGKEKYSKTYQLTDVNYAVASLDAKQRRKENRRLRLLPSRSFCARSTLRLHRLPRTGRAVMNRPLIASSTVSNRLQIMQGKK